jgi:hypothetical protein
VEELLLSVCNIHRVSDVRQVEIHTAEPLVPGRSHLRFKFLIPAGGEILRSKIHELINYLWNKEELPDQWKESIIERTHRKDNST